MTSTKKELDERERWLDAKERAVDRAYKLLRTVLGMHQEVSPIIHELCDIDPHKDPDALAVRLKELRESLHATEAMWKKIGMDRAARKGTAN